VSSVADTPIDLAIEFLCNTFNLFNSSSEPNCFTTSFVAPAISPSKESCLAL